MREAGSQIASIDTILASWRQGDCVLGAQWFVHRIAKPSIMAEAREAFTQADADLVEMEVPGFIVVTQTCDIVRSRAERPFIELCPLVEVDADRLEEIKRCRRPAYAFVPQLSGKQLVADLDRVMTVVKDLVATWKRTPGWITDAEARAFALALSRKRARFAFPDDFSVLTKKLLGRLSDKHEKNTNEGRGLRALQEIRVQASPSWDADKVDIFFWFIREEGNPDFEGKNWADLLSEWLSLVPEMGRFHSVLGQVTTLEDMTARQYVDSDRLDLDYVSLML